MNNSAYWANRLSILEEAENKDARIFIEGLEDQIILAELQIDKDIAHWYNRFADNNEISLAEAKKRLNSDELQEFIWTVEEYIRFGESVGLSPQYIKQLENASAKYHISRLEALKIDIQQSTEVLFQNQLDSLDAFLRERYTESYYRTGYEVQKGFKVGFDLVGVNQLQLEKVLTKPWAPDYLVFSDRIWKDKERLLNEIYTGLTQNIILGKPPDQLIKLIVAKFNTSKSNAGRLVMTESAFIHSAAQKQLFDELDVEEYQILATLDSHTSMICQELDKKIFRSQDYQVGVTAPPFHPNCRTITVPYFEDNVIQRAARDSKGKTYFVENMNYKKWKERQVA